MAYSDYGSFVYLNGLRRKDREDVAIFNDDEADLPSGMRIYANLLKNMDREDEIEWWEHSHHGVLGDGDVRVGLYKQGLYASYIYHLNPETNQVESYGWRHFAEFAGLSLKGKVNEDGELECENYEDLLYGNYHLEFELFDHKFEFIGDDSKFPKYEARMTTPDGDSWVCKYDYAYGAGLSDVEIEGKDFNKLENADINPMLASYVETEVYDEDRDADVEISLVVDSTNGKILYRGEKYIGNGGLSIEEYSTVSYRDGYIRPEGAIELLNEGIKLGKSGYDTILRNGGSCGGIKYTDLDDFEFADRDAFYYLDKEVPDEIEQYNEEMVYSDFRRYHEKDYSSVRMSTSEYTLREKLALCAKILKS